MTYTGDHFDRFSDFFAALSPAARDVIADVYGAPRADARSLATHICDHAEDVVAVVDAALGEPDARALMQEVVLDHDLEVPLMPSSLASRKTLVRLGIIPDARASHAVVPGVWAAILSNLLVGTRTSAMTLVGNVDDERLAQMCRAWGITSTRRIADILAVADQIAAEGSLAEIVERLPDLDYMGAAMVAIELGGICFWQEVFGYDIEPAQRDAKIVPFMRRDERAIEQDIAESLCDHGVIFRIDEGEAPMLVVPEELWQPIWELGRGWLLDWVADTYEATSLTGQRRDDADRSDLQATLKFLILEADAARLRWHVDGLHPDTYSRLEAIGAMSAPYWEETVDLAMQLGVLRPDGDQLVSNEAAESTLDLPRQAFGRQVLFDWCMGFVGRSADTNLAKAMGLDDVWRMLVLKVLRRADEFVPLWMLHEGVAPLVTGAGCLRDVEDSPDDLLVQEFGICNAIVWTAKLIWLDVLSLLPAEYWYSKRALAELLQVVSAFATFSHIAQVLERPDLGIYVPLQRASFMTDPFHTGEFELWVDDVTKHLLLPLGIAALHDESQSIWLDSASLRIQTPPGLKDEHREQLVREVFADAEMTFKVPGNANMRLHRVPAALADHEMALDAPLAAVRAWLGSRTLTRFDGQRVRVD